MKEFIEITFQEVTEQITELLIAELSELGYDGFLEEGDTLKTYIEVDQFEEAVVSEWAKKLGLTFIKGNIREQNWNAEWEKSFDPVVIGDKIAIRASFHKPILEVEKEIVITPKMSFGTGHHATTYLMVKTMLDISFSGKKVLDFGTGTGILAILAELMGASSILAIDHDAWSMDNANENVKANGCTRIELELKDTIPKGLKFDIILANINRHILVEQANFLVHALEKGGILIMSGILTEDRDAIRSTFGKDLGEPISEEIKQNWMLIRFEHV